MNLKNLKHLKKGFKELTPIQLSEGKQWGYAGMIVGLGLACVRMFQSGSWGLGIFLFFLSWLQIVMLVGERQAYNGLKSMQKNLEEIKNEMESME